MTGTKTAQAWGLVNVVKTDQNLLQRAWDLAALIAETDITTMGKIKTLVDTSQNTGLDEGLKQEVSVFNRHIKGVLTNDIEIRRS